MFTKIDIVKPARLTHSPRMIFVIIGVPCNQVMFFHILTIFVLAVYIRISVRVRYFLF